VTSLRTPAGAAQRGTLRGAVPAVKPRRTPAGGAPGQRV